MILNRVGAGRRRLSALIMSLAAFCVAAGQSPPTNLKDVPKTLAPMVETELAFAAAARARGIKDSFIEYAADDGLLFRRTAVNAKELWRQTNPAPTGLLSWYPTYADVSRAGDLGWTTGPWEFRARPGDKEASGHGHFVTVWRRQADGAWRFALDIGISHAAPAVQEKTLKFPGSAKKGGAAGSLKEAERARASILEAEAELARDAASDGVGPALLARASEGVRLYREGAPPQVGKPAATAIHDKEAGGVTFKAAGAGASRSGDLGYAYGTYEAGGPAGGGGNYVRIWKREGGKWRVVVGVTNPVPPAGKD